jgi:hypothetical protein
MHPFTHWPAPLQMVPPLSEHDVNCATFEVAQHMSAQTLTMQSVVNAGQSLGVEQAWAPSQELPPASPPELLPELLPDPELLPELDPLLEPELLPLPDPEPLLDPELLPESTPPPELEPLPLLDAEPSPGLVESLAPASPLPPAPPLLELPQLAATIRVASVTTRFAPTRLTTSSYHTIDCQLSRASSEATNVGSGIIRYSPSAVM